MLTTWNLLAQTNTCFRWWKILPRISLQNGTSPWSLRRRDIPTSHAHRLAAKPDAVLDNLVYFLGTTKTPKNRITASAQALNNLWKLFGRTSAPTEAHRLRVYYTCVCQILLFKCSTSRLTKQRFQHSESFHSLQLCMYETKTLYPACISNDDLYERTRCVSLGLDIFKAR